ncbi:MAG: tRNA dihydrouridine synthase DusB [Candidatus Omnitrophica bacterium]|nr:tRNA dihydrouridine synthase DusB [Candidatus Omnitrophota bacterium]
MLEKLKNSLKIGSSSKSFMLPRIMLAPLSGVSSLPFRKLNREAGCKFAFLEMISARSLSYSSRRTLEMLSTEKSDQPLGVQLLGDDSYDILKALEKLRDFPYGILDLNAACPRRKITSNGKGAALLKSPKKLQKLLSNMVKEANLPVTVKLRLGWDSAKNIVNIAKYAQDAGIAGVCLHGRTREQGYRDSIDYLSIEKVKKALSIPVIASGDIFSASKAKEMFDQTNCDAIIVARGALGNPWIFKEIEEFLTKGKVVARPTIKEVAKMMKKHLDLSIGFYGERIGTVEFRKFYIWYTRGFLKTKTLRTSTHQAKSRLEMFKLIKDFSAIAKSPISLA